MSLFSHNDEGMILKADLNLGDVPENIMSNLKLQLKVYFQIKLILKLRKEM